MDSIEKVKAKENIFVHDEDGVENLFAFDNSLHESVITLHSKNYGK